MLRLGDEAFESASLEGSATVSANFSGLTDPRRTTQKQVSGGVSAIMFDFDGTLTATPGDRSARRYKIAELKERSGMLRPWLERLGGAGIVMGIISKSTEDTILTALGVAGLLELFQGPIVGKAVGFEGKAGFIEALCETGLLSTLRPGISARSVLLVDDDILELNRCREHGIQTYPAPLDGGLQDDEFREVCLLLGIQAPAKPKVTEAAREPASVRGLR
ncbi:unnamed protein product [Prorocentrum cordatum]|uniref:Uncharacterized protein n=1 Tax=Prorocentrum cordatum TaxID=2364126 RepID=A0ABN9UL02_9DINO|nr:unnamed protein product [Polarella glacialis]